MLRNPKSYCENDCVACEECIEEYEDERCFDPGCCDDGAAKECLNFRCKEKVLVERIDAKHLKISIDKLRIYCSRRKEGCDWIGTSSSQDSHEETCPFKIIRCPNKPYALILRNYNLSTHRRTDCQHQKIACPR